MYLYILCLAISLAACVAGAICGIGGGVIIKPALDAVGVMSVSAVSFLSGCTVLSMTCYSVIKGFINKDSSVRLKTGVPLALGAAIGGIAGKSMFQYVCALFTDQDMVGAVQAVCLIIVTLATLIYTINKDKVRTLTVENAVATCLIGLAMGVISSFLGIGGGPINLVVLYFFFSMQTKEAAQNSLFIILFSQLASLANTLVTGTVPAFEPAVLVLMVIGGISGGIIGRAINKKIDDSVVNKLFIGIMLVIIGINIYNVYRFIG